MKKKLIAILTILMLVFAFTACGSSSSSSEDAAQDSQDVQEEQATQAENPYAGEWEFIGSTDIPENVDDILTAELEKDQLFTDVITLNEDGTFTELNTTTLNNEPIDMDMHGTWKPSEKGVTLTYEYDNGVTSDWEYLVTSDGTTLVYSTPEEYIEEMGAGIASVFRKK